MCIERQTMERIGENNWQWNSVMSASIQQEISWIS